MHDVDTLIDEHGLALDPFAFHGHPASCIDGIGGEAPLPDPTYAFHTMYVPAARGHAHFTISFAGLTARQGTLWLRVHMLPGAPGAVARMVTSQRLQLSWLAHHGGEVRLRFEAFRGASYAVMGLVPDGTDAAAQGLTVRLDRPAGPEDLIADALDAAAEPEAAPPDDSAIRHAGLLLSLDPPVFSLPVSQPCTAAQLREQAFHEQAGRRAVADDWPAAYLLQVLGRYGALRPGARGLALGVGAGALAATIERAGASCRTVPIGGEDGIGPATLPGELDGFDFVLSLRATDVLADDAAARAFLDGAMECLRPGGLAAHVVGFAANGPAGRGWTFDRAGLERAALGLISRGHQAARLKPGMGERLAAGADGVVSFGLVARRASSIL